MIFKHHSLTIRQETRTGTGGVAYGSATSFMGQVTPMGQGKTAQEYGIELDRPHLLIADSSLATLMKIGALVSYGSRRFKVKSTGAVYDIGTVADHASCVIEEIEPEDHNA